MKERKKGPKNVAEAKQVYLTHRQQTGSVAGSASVFKITRGGKRRSYEVDSSFGYFIEPFKKATSVAQISALVDGGIASKEIAPVIQYLGLRVPEIAKATAVSPSTVSRWEPDTSIGVAGTNQFFKIDEIIKKGVSLFGGPNELKAWLDAPNLALGNHVPLRMLTSQIEVELVDEALDALRFGNVM